MIAFVEGDPDRPIIVGAVPDAETPSPVEQANQTQNVLRTESGNEVVMEDLRGSERIRLYTPHAGTTLQLGAPDESEEGVLLSTAASITAASASSINDVTDGRVLLCGMSSALVGESAVLLAGVDGLLPAVEVGMQRIGAVVKQRDAILASVDRIAKPPGQETDDNDNDEQAAPLAQPRPQRGEGGGRFSDLAADLAARARTAAAQAISAMARAANAHVERALGRLQGHPAGHSEGPSAIVGSPATAALFGRDSALVFGDRSAALASQDTASVSGGRLAQLKSPSSVEVAGGEEARLTSAGAAGVEASVVRIAGGYFPKQEAPRFHPMTTVGVISRGEIELVSGDDCVLVCADKDVIVTAHSGSMKLTAQQHASISAGSVSVSGSLIRLASGADIEVHADGSISVEAAGDVRVKAGGTVTVSGAAVELSGGAITLNGPVNILGDLSVAGTVNGKRL
jgi:hypothetical protein